MSLSIQNEYRCKVDLDLYSSPQCEGLATQAAIDRHLRIVSLTPIENAIAVRLCEDDYPAWLDRDDLGKLAPTRDIYEPATIDRNTIEERIPEVIAFAEAAMSVPNQYLWGGTVAPNYDCSGLMQAAFQSQGIWLPRDAYQQQDFVQPISIEEILPGDLIFFQGKGKIDHVGLHLGNLRYIHSSGIEMGRNGIDIDILAPDTEDPFSLAYYAKFYGCGRVMTGYPGIGEEMSNIDSSFQVKRTKIKAIAGSINL
jgi:hypothetical protein